MISQAPMSLLHLRRRRHIWDNSGTAHKPMNPKFLFSFFAIPSFQMAYLAPVSAKFGTFLFSHRNNQLSGKNKARDFERFPRKTSSVLWVYCHVYTQLIFPERQCVLQTSEKSAVHG